MKNVQVRWVVLMFALAPGFAICQDSTSDNVPAVGSLPIEEVFELANNEDLGTEVVEEIQIIEGASIEGASIEGASIEGASIEAASIEAASIEGQKSIELQDVKANEEPLIEQLPGPRKIEVDLIQVKATILSKNVKVTIDMNENDLIYINYAYAFLQMKDKGHFGRWGMNPVYSQGSYIFDTDVQTLKKNQEDYCEILGNVMPLIEAKKHSIEMKLVSIDSPSTLQQEKILVFEANQLSTKLEKLQLRCTLFGEKQVSLEEVQKILGNDHVKIELAQIY